ncbi:MAG: hypothetical protein OEX98_03525 [Nitrosopumilus sp.]|nr:hypothetical protein [Nitrosopumilus sp.]
MVYSNALYFTSHFDRLTDELLSSFSVKEKSQKTIIKNNTNLNNLKD